MSFQDQGSKSLAPVARSPEVQANKQAELFVDVYYSTYDSASRPKKLPELYRFDARIVWNGNAISGPASLREALLTTMSYTKHEILSFNAHVIPGSTLQPLVLPTISITVSGQLMTSSTRFPSNFRMPDQKDIPSNLIQANSQEDLNRLPRVFSQNFILAPSPQATEPNPSPSISNYLIIADCFRFVG
ncbi:hypothetical protein BY996DRAFT_4578967 [Phakopsora pachyrhizi]|uniref:NTF2 domain-containing protein n=1 Tax=Phakopsora pachyrhizi TaxID=170000 RepID=A0AAV0AVZ9_PHAPC|nr:hypothetical protein BY996DRAFT_4578967 [Phakopsora pachyrhizi]CAH7672740.1 hypothetical protein PPACK8108_LOCUS7574 [Phakopsora pachyrhizi]